MKIFIIFGTRPEVIKLFPVIRELRKYKNVSVKICATAQHREMLDQFLKFFNIEPDYDLNIMEKNQTPSYVSSQVFLKLEPILRKEKPDYIVIEGDTTTVAASALCAFYNKIKVAHVEAGLRTYDKWQPFPEEINRRVVTTVADLHFAPTKRAKENLLKEGVDEKKIYVTGNPVVDSLLYIANLDFNSFDFDLKKLNLSLESDTKKLILVTAHRRENFGEPLKNICYSLKTITEIYKDKIWIVYPVHLNPNVWESVHEILSGIENIKLIPPVDYFSLIYLLKNSYFVMTDSGGIQEEAPSFGKPVLVLRDVTERPEGIEAGVAKLVGTQKERIVNEAIKLIEDEKEYNKMAKAINPYGDGKAGERIARILASTSGVEIGF
ncbi:MAG: UDP-N-acetylglucosamine 2-epimerase (non-hydrolyzing) [candidate division WOR-3 bacterium]